MPGRVPVLHLLNINQSTCPSVSENVQRTSGSSLNVFFYFVVANVLGFSFCLFNYLTEAAPNKQQRAKIVLKCYLPWPEKE